MGSQRASPGDNARIYAKLSESGHKVDGGFWVFHEPWSDSKIAVELNVKKASVMYMRKKEFGRLRDRILTDHSEKVKSDPHETLVISLLSQIRLCGERNEAMLKSLTEGMTWLKDTP